MCRKYGVSFATLDKHKPKFGGLDVSDADNTVMAAVQSHVNDAFAYAIVYSLHHENGDDRWIQADGKANRDDAGNAIKFVGAVEDITNDRVTSMALRERNQQLNIPEFF